MKKIFLIFAVSSFMACSFFTENNENFPIVKTESKINDSVLVEYFIMPKDIIFEPGSFDIEKYGVVLGYTDNGYLRRSIYTDFGNRRYNCLVKKDSICEYFYFSKIEPVDVIEKQIICLQNIEYKQELIFSRILLRYHYKDSIKEIKIDNNYVASFKGKKYKIDSLCFSSIINNAPKEIQENWLYRLGGINYIR